MAFSDGTNVFGSVGADGSLRIFDLRSLESSTIVYESQGLQPLLKVGWNKQDSRYLATIIAGSATLVILDLRNAARPVFELNAHVGNINSLSWSEHSRHHICSAAEDGRAIIYDVSSSADNVEMASVVFQAAGPINQVRWSPQQPNYIGLCETDAVRVVQV